MDVSTYVSTYVVYCAQVVDFSNNNHSLVSVIVLNSRPDLDDQQDIGCCTACTALQNTSQASPCWYNETIIGLIFLFF